MNGNRFFVISGNEFGVSMICTTDDTQPLITWAEAERELDQLVEEGYDAGAIIEVLPTRLRVVRHFCEF